MFCMNCGIKLDEDAKFCFGCGTAVDVESETDESQKYTDSPQQKVVETDFHSEVVNTNLQPENKKNDNIHIPTDTTITNGQKIKKKKPFWMILLFIVVGLISAFIIYSFVTGGISFTSEILNDVKTASSIDQKSLPINETDTFAPDTPFIYVTTTVKNVPVNTEITATWYYIDSNIEIASVSSNTSGQVENIQFNLSKPNNGFPIGQYEVKLYIDKKYEKSIKFVVQLQNSQALLNPIVQVMANSNTALVDGTMVKIDSTNSNVMPIIRNGVTLIPLRFMADTFGTKIELTDNGVVTYYVDKGGKQITALFTEGSGTYILNGQEYEHGSEVVVIEGRLMVPLRIVVEKFLNKSLTITDNQITIK